MSESARKDTPEQAEFRDYCRQWLQENRPSDPPVRLPQSPLGIMTVDQMGSMFARREGREDLPPVLVGSHLDTQIAGGRYDGIVGVLAGLEIVRTLNDLGN